MNKLTPHPFQPAGLMIERFAENRVPSWLRGPFRFFLRLWRQRSGVDLADQQLRSIHAQGGDPYHHDDWIMKNLFYPQVSCSFLCQTPVDSSNYLWNLALGLEGICKFYLQVKDGNFRETVGKYEVDTSRYKNLFSTSTLSTISRGLIRHRVTQSDPSDYVILWCKNKAFKLRVLDNEEFIPAESLYRSLETIVSNSSKSDGIPIGTLTILANEHSIAKFSDFRDKNMEQFLLIEQALFSTAIVDCSPPRNMNDIHRSLHVGDFTNRDWRSTLTLVTNSAGNLAIVVNPYPGIGGTLSARLTSEISKNLIRPRTPVPEGVDHKDLFSPIHFDQEEQMDTSVLFRAAERRLYDLKSPTSFKTEIHRSRFEHGNIRPGAATIAALSRSWYQLYHTVPTIGNFINLRHVRNGDIWRYRAHCRSLSTFTKTPTWKNYQNFEKDYVITIAEQKKASDPFYLGAMSLKKLISERRLPFLSFVSLMVLLRVFIRNFNKDYINPNIWISGIPSFEGTIAAGRAGSTMDYLDKDSIGGHYMILPDYVQICLLGHPKGKYRGTEALFAKQFGNELEMILDLPSAKA